MKNNITSSLSALALLIMATTTQAATVTWGSATNITGDTDVQTSPGTLFTALNFGTSTAATVNGVTFNGFASTGAGSNSVITSGDGKLSFSSDSGFSTYNGFGSASAPFSSLPADYQTLLATGVYGNSGTYTFTNTLNNLTIGNQYSFQFWNNDSRDGEPNRLLNGVGARPNGANGQLGQYAIGTFTADATTQSISLFGNGYLNAVEVRDLTTAAPEPTISAFFGLGTLGILLRRRRRTA